MPIFDIACLLDAKYNYFSARRCRQIPASLYSIDAARRFSSLPAATPSQRRIASNVGAIASACAIIYRAALARQLLMTRYYRLEESSVRFAKYAPIRRVYLNYRRRWSVGGAQRLLFASFDGLMPMMRYGACRATPASSLSDAD